MELLEFKDTKTIPDIVHLYESSLQTNAAPIIIDNGKMLFSSFTVLIKFFQVPICQE